MSNEDSQMDTQDTSIPPIPPIPAPRRSRNPSGTSVKSIDSHVSFQEQPEISQTPPSQNPNLPTSIDFRDFHKRIFTELTQLHSETLKIIPPKKKTKYKEIVAKFNDSFKDWMEEEDTLHLDKLFGEVSYPKNSNKTLNVMTTLRESLVFADLPPIQINVLDNKYDIITLNSLEHAKEYIHTYSIEYHNEFSKIHRNSIYLALNGGFYLNQIKKLCKEKQLKLANEERSNFKFKNFIQECNVKWSYPYIQFLVKLYNLCEKYPRLKYVTIRLDFLKNNFKAIKNGIEVEADQWK